MPDDENVTGGAPQGLATGEEAPAGSVVKSSDMPGEDEAEDTELMDMFSSVETPMVEVTTPEVTPAAVTPSPAPEVKTPVQATPVPAVQSPQAAVPPTPAGVVPPPQAAAPAAGAQGVQPQPGVQEPQQPSATPASGTTGEPPDAFQQLDSLIEAQRPKVIDAVAVGSYQLSAEEIEGIQTEPEKVVPKLLAKVHVNAVQGVIRHVAAQLPGMLNSMLQVRETHQREEQKFWDAWPELDKGKHSPQVMQTARLFRQQYPTASQEEFVRFVGAQVMLMNGLARAPKPQQVQTPQVVPFRPAGAGQGGGSVPAGQPQLQGWDVIAQAMQEDN